MVNELFVALEAGEVEHHFQIAMTKGALGLMPGAKCRFLEW